MEKKQRANPDKKVEKSDYIHLVFVDNDDTHYVFKIRIKNYPMKRVISKFHEVRELSPDDDTNSQFFFNSKPLPTDKSAEDLRMKNGDIVQVVTTPNNSTPLESVPPISGEEIKQMENTVEKVLIDLRRDYYPSHLNLKVIDEREMETYFRIKQSTQLVRLIDAYCKRNGLKKEKVNFCYDGVILEPQKSPMSYHMEENDVIEVFSIKTDVNLPVDPPIKIRIINEYLEEYTYQVEREQELEQLFRAYKQKKKIFVTDPDNVIFFYQKKEINATKTAKDYNIKDGETIICKRLNWMINLFFGKKCWYCFEENENQLKTCKKCNLGTFCDGCMEDGYTFKSKFHKKMCPIYLEIGRTIKEKDYNVQFDGVEEVLYDIMMRGLCTRNQVDYKFFLEKKFGDQGYEYWKQEFKRRSVFIEHFENVVKDFENYCSKLYKILKDIEKNKRRIESERNFLKLLEEEKKKKKKNRGRKKAKKKKKKRAKKKQQPKRKGSNGSINGNPTGNTNNNGNGDEIDGDNKTIEKNGDSAKDVSSIVVDDDLVDEMSDEKKKKLESQMMEYIREKKRREEEMRKKEEDRLRKRIKQQELEKLERENSLKEEEEDPEEEDDEETNTGPRFEDRQNDHHHTHSHSHPHPLDEKVEIFDETPISPNTLAQDRQFMLLNELINDEKDDVLIMSQKGGNINTKRNVSSDKVIQGPGQSQYGKYWNQSKSIGGERERNNQVQSSLFYSNPWDMGIPLQNNHAMSNNHSQLNDNSSKRKVVDPNNKWEINEFGKEFFNLVSSTQQTPIEQPRLPIIHENSDRVLEEEIEKVRSELNSKIDELQFGFDEEKRMFLDSKKDFTKTIHVLKGQMKTYEEETKILKDEQENKKKLIETLHKTIKDYEIQILDLSGKRNLTKIKVVHELTNIKKDYSRRIDVFIKKNMEIDRLIKSLNEKQNICKFCNSRKKSHVLITCGHFLCDVCARRMMDKKKKCPFDGKLVKLIQKCVFDETEGDKDKSDSV